jgi:hypothetical protein
LIEHVWLSLEVATAVMFLIALEGAIAVLFLIFDKKCETSLHVEGYDADS